MAKNESMKSMLSTPSSSKDKSLQKRIIWKHPGGKMERLGPDTLSDAELLAVIISSGIPGKPAEKIAEEIVSRFGSFRGIAGQPYEKFEKIGGLGKVKIHRLAATFEISTRIVDEILKEYNIKLKRIK